MKLYSLWQKNVNVSWQQKQKIYSSKGMRLKFHSSKTNDEAGNSCFFPPDNPLVKDQLQLVEAALGSQDLGFEGRSHELTHSKLHGRKVSFLSEARCVLEWARTI